MREALGRSSSLSVSNQNCLNWYNNPCSLSTFANHSQAIEVAITNEAKPMRLLVTLIGWCEYPPDHKMPAPHVWDLSDPPTRTKMIVLFGNGVIGELRAESEDASALQLLQRIILGPGACHPHQLADHEHGQLWLYQPGDECYLQEGEPPGYVFVNPIPQPHLFA